MAKSRKSTKPVVIDATTRDMSAEVVTTDGPSPEDLALASIVAGLNVPDDIVEPTIETPVEPDADDTVVEAAEPATDDADSAALAELDKLLADAGVPAVEAPAPSTEDVADAVSASEASEAMLASASPDSGDAAVMDEESDVTDPEAEAAPEAEKKPRTPRKHYTNKAERIKDRLGEGLGEVTVLTLDDAASALDEEALKAKMDETMALIAGMSKKKQNRAGFLLEFVGGKKAELNAVMKKALEVLHTEGKITTGKDGNYLTALLKTYTPAAARAMGGNTVAVLDDLKLIQQSEKGTYVANPDSLLLGKVNDMLGFTAQAAE